MKLSKWIVIGLAATSALGLTACSKTPNAASEQPTLTQGSNGNAGKAYAVNNQGKYSSAQYGFHKNSLTAPSNQTYYFAFNKAQLETIADKPLTIQANYLASHPNAKIRLQGNTDSRGSEKYNYDLGLRRDQAVAAYLEQHGVSPSQINMISYGKERPAVTVAELGRQSIEMVWALNRRVNMVYLTK